MKPGNMTDEEFARSLPAHGGAVILVNRITESRPLKNAMEKIRGKDFLRLCKMVSIPDAGWLDRLEGMRGPIYIHDSFLHGPLHPSDKARIIADINSVNALVKLPPVY